MGGKCAIIGGLTCSEDGDDSPVKDVGWREECDAAVVVLFVVPAEELLQPPAGSNHVLESDGVVPWYFIVLKRDSLKALSLDTLARLNERDTPSDANNWASVSLFIEEPRSAWTMRGR